MMNKKLSGRMRRILAVVLVAAILMGGVIVDWASTGKRNASLRSLTTYAYLDDTMECLSYGWIRWMTYVLGTDLSDEGDALGQYRRACINVAAGDYEAAEQWMRQCVDSQAESSEEERAVRYLQLACIRSLEGDRTGAVEAARAASDLVPGQQRAQELYYQLSMDAGDSGNAADALARCVDITKDVTQYEQIAQLYLDAGNYEESGRYYGLALENDGDNENLYHMRGNCWMLLGRYEDAIQDFSKTQTPGSLYLRGLCEMALGEYEEAGQSMERSIERVEQVSEAQMMLGICRLETGQYASAEALFDQYLSGGGAYEEIAYFRATARMMQTDYEGAAEDYAAAIQADSYVQESTFALAQCRYSLGEYEAAIDLFEQCLEQQIEVSESWYYLGLSKAATGDHEGAKEALSNALGIDEASEDEVDE